MVFRFTDIDSAASGVKDFITRSRTPSVLQVTALLLTALIISLSIIVSVTDKLALISILCILIAAVGWYVLVQTQQNRDLVLATEFQNALFSAAMNMNSKFCLIIRPDGTMVYLDRSFQELFREFLRQPRRNFAIFLEYAEVSNKDRDALYASFARGVPEQVTLDIRTGDGQTEKIVMSIEPIKRPSGFILLRAHDFIEKRSGEAPAYATENSRMIAVPASDIPLSDFIEHSPIPIIRLDEKGNLTRGNQAFHRLTRDLLRQRLPMPFLSLVSSARQTDAEAILTSASKGEIPTEPQSFDFTFAPGFELILSAYISRLEDGLILHLIDITEQKNLEMRFAHSQKMQAVGQLAGGVAHDFNNLLTAMIGFCDLLLMRHPAGDQSFADIMQIKQNANRAANLVRQLLAFSRRQTLQPKVLDLTDVLAELSNLVRRLIGENIELKMVHGRDIGHVRADQGQLEQVLINLAVNARDAMPSGGQLTIRTSRTTIDRDHPLSRDLIAPAEEDTTIPNGDYVLVEVIDTGTGIPKAILQKIFEPFFSTKAVGSGTGLGLSTVYGIIKQTGGYIYVSSRENEGTSFSIFFPAIAPEEAKASAAESESADKAAAVDLTGKGTILLVEDETPVRIFAARALRNKGYTVIEADCGDTAIELMAKHGKEVEVIVTDVIMPGMNGPTMIDKITPLYPNVKVIFISGYAEDVFVNNYGTERSFNFLAKPFTLKQLAGKIKEVTG